ncbi:MAG: beta-glucosidase BglX [Sphingorhabdus sp.]
MTLTKTALFSLLAMTLLAGCSAASLPPPELATKPSIAAQPDIGAKGHRQIDALISRMTLEEKIGQMTLFSANWAVTGAVTRDTYRSDIKAGKVGAIFSIYTAEKTRELQRIAVEETRLGIPLIFGFDVIHGHRTIFPIPLGEAASWDMTAIEKSARVSAREASAEGLHWTFAPMVDIARDPRWGRIAEGAGEDVYLASKIARARVKGLQGDDLAAPDTILATVKHFAAYGAAQAGRDYHNTDMSDRELRQTYLPPFWAALDAGAATIMTSFNALDGVPATGNKYLLTDILRKEWGFDGFVVTDYTSINEMVPHGFAKDEKHAGEQAINAGVDMDMQGAVFLTHLARSVREGRISTAQVDTAVKRILEMKYRLGLFDDPYRYSDSAREKAEIYKPENLEAARDVARRSIVLLKNENSTLPLAKNIASIAVIGRLADSKSDMIGSWSAAGDRKEKPVTLLEGLRHKFGDAVKIEYAKGADYRLDSKPDPEGLRKAVALAKRSDIVIAALGERWSMTGEAASRTDLQLPGHQLALLKALKATGKPVILVLMNGRPLAISWANDNVDAIIEAWYPGSMGGHAIADILVGDYNPSGKLPVTFPRNVGQVPIYYNMQNTGRPMREDEPNQKFVSRYLATPNTPLYPFGYGLSYTRFDYSDITVSSKNITLGQTLHATVTVTNTGDHKGEETVQLYIQDLVGSVTRPVKELRGFEKILLAPGESRTVKFAIGSNELYFLRKDMTYGTEPGKFRIFIGTSSSDTQMAEFELSETAP